MTDMRQYITNPYAPPTSPTDPRPEERKGIGGLPIGRVQKLLERSRNGEEIEVTISPTYRIRFTHGTVEKWWRDNATQRWLRLPTDARFPY